MFLHHERGNFLLQALLALTLVFAFMPFFTRRLASRDIGAQMYATTHQLETVKNAARLYVLENSDALPYDTTVVSGNNLSDLLEPYGLPLGFIARTPLGQDISVVIIKNETDVYALVRVAGGELTKMQRAELARRIGFYASYNPASDSDVIEIGIPLAENYSDIVRRNERNSDVAEFLTDLDMGGFNFVNTENIFARRANFDTGIFDKLSVFGTEAGRNVRNKILQINADKTIFQNESGKSSLSVVRGTLNTNDVFAKTVSKFGDTGNMLAVDASVDALNMSEGRTGFYGPEKWDVRGNVITSRISFSTERLDVSSFINLTRGQDVYIDEDDLSYNTSSGIDTAYLYSSNVTLRDQTSGGLQRGASGAAILDVRPAGTSMLPDVLIDGVDNNAFSILAYPTQDSSDTVTCKTIIESYGNTYNQKSLAQYIVCQYVFWQRLESRINAAICIKEGKSGCI